MKLLLTALACVAAALLALAWRSGEGLHLVEVSRSDPQPLDAAASVAKVDSRQTMQTATAGMPPSGASSLSAAPQGSASSAPASPRTAVPAAAASSAPDTSTTLLLPVQGIAIGQLHDTFTDARGEGRVHDAIDIMAPAGTPVLAVADGHIEKLFDSERGGLTIYQFEPGGRFAYYYAHLQRYADGLAEKQSVRRGQVLGYVGSTGNASPDAPHLHFAIFVLGPERHWWEGAAINPYPILRGEQPLP